MGFRPLAERKSEREYVVSIKVNGPATLVFEAWSKPEQFRCWWVPKSAPMTLVTCEMDVRVGGKYRLVFEMNSQKFEVFGKYLEVNPPTRLVWTNDEGGKEAGATTTITFKETDGLTLVTVHDLYPSKDELDAAIDSGLTSGLPIQLEQLNEFITAR